MGLLLGVTAAAFDRAATLAARASNLVAGRQSRAENMSHEERVEALHAIAKAYDTDHFFIDPKPITPKLERVRGMRDGITVFDASWPSEFETYLSELRERYASTIENRTARARLYLAKTPRPAIVLIHGYMGGQWNLEERAWPIAWLAERYDLAIAVLPFHAIRGAKTRRGPPPFPGPDPRVTNEGFRQAMLDLQSIVRFMKSRGSPSVGAMGMSLGGYSTALLATVEPNLAFAAPIIPLASLADFARDQGRLGEGLESEAQHAALEDAYRVVSPLTRKSLLAKDRVLVVAGDSDRITPVTHAKRIAAHFGARVVRFEGGHILQFGRADAFRAIGRFLSNIPAT